MQKQSRPWWRMVATVAAIGLLAASCGGRDDTTDSGSGGTDDTSADEKKELADAPGFSLSAKTIKVGALTPLSGPVADPIGIPLTAGGDVYWQKVNAAGGVAGKYKVEVVKEDTKYDNAETKAKYTKIKNDVVLFSQILGTPPTKTVLPDLKTDKIVASPASLDSAWIREENLLPIGSTYQLQFINAASYALENGFKGKPICFLGIEGEYGDAGKEGLEFAAGELDFKVASEARFKATDQDFTAQITQLKNASCAAVFLTALPSNTGKIIGTGAQQGFTPQWIAQSPTWVGALAASAVAPVLQKAFWWTSEGTSWGDETVPGMKEMVADVKQFAPQQKPDNYFIFGYAQAKGVHALLEKAVEDGDLSREGVLKALEELEVDYDGLLGDYKYGKVSEREPSRETVIFKVDPAVPGALAKLEAVTSDAAKAFKFE